MFCARCGSKLADDAAFCPNCGLVTGNAGQVQPGAGQPAAPGQSQPQTESRALAALILGILGLFFSIVAGIPAIILGRQSLATIKASSGKVTGEGMAMAGQVLGWISVALVPFLVVIAIPSLHHSMSEVHWQEGPAGVRTLISAENTYLREYPKAGYAPDLATLGPGGPMCPGGEGTEKNACMIDGELGCSAGTSGNWCEKDEYRYSIVGIYKNGVPDDFVITAMRAGNNAGAASYCASSDGVVRYRLGIPPSLPIKTVAECSSWAAL